MVIQWTLFITWNLWEVRLNMVIYIEGDVYLK